MPSANDKPLPVSSDTRCIGDPHPSDVLAAEVFRHVAEDLSGIGWHPQAPTCRMLFAGGNGYLPGLICIDRVEGGVLAPGGPRSSTDLTVPLGAAARRGRQSPAHTAVIVAIPL
jgi:hypothetical protein